MHPLEQKILRSDPVLRCYLALIAPSGKSRFVLWLVILPLALFAVFCKITHQEARFDLGSLDLPVAPGSHDVFVGLSFLGDSMVWPYFLLVPLLLVMLRVAIGKTVVLREKCGELVRPEIHTDAASDPQFQCFIAQADTTLCYRNRSWRWLWRGALVLGLVFFLFNTVACIRGDAWPSALLPYDHLWKFLKPYSLNRAVIKSDTVVLTLREPMSFITPCGSLAATVCLPPLLSKLAVDPDRRRLAWSGSLSLDERRALAELWPSSEWQQVVHSLATQKQEGFISDIHRPMEKWDTDLRGAPWSWAATRVWVLLIGYALLPLAVLRVWNLVVVVWQFAMNLARADMLKANPYASESRVSLDLIIQPLFAANYCLLVVSTMAALALVKVGAEPGWHDLALLALIPVFAFVALAPLLSISNMLDRHVKKLYLSPHTTAIAGMHLEFRNATVNLGAAARGECAASLTKYGDYIARGEEAVIFPISVATITRFAAPVAPLVLTLVQKAIGNFF